MVSRAQVGWPLLRRAAAALALIVALYCAIGPAAARADVAPQLWLPTSADLVRTLRPCTEKVSAPTPPICWSVREDLSAWMALPPGSPYPWGQCVYYAGLMRPDIWNDRAPPSIDRLDDWNAWTWAAHAQAEGLSADGNPRPGDLMVYSGRALGNGTGHLAIVDAVGTTATSGDLLVTVSEMNVEGLDDPARGQGDTITIPLPRSQLVPGMIQFIHQPSPGYVPPVWAGGTGAADVGGKAPSAAGDPSLAVGLFGDRLETVSESAAPAHAVVTPAASGRTVTRLRLAANRVVTLHLPRGRYRVCVTQPATGRWTAASACTSGVVRRRHTGRSD